VPGLQALRARHKLMMLEDCAQAIGAKSHGKPVGTAGQSAIVSFYPTKNLGALGSGGAVLTDAAEIAGLASRLRNYGQGQKYSHDHPGLNSRIDEIQAAILRECMLPRLAEFTARRNAIAQRYQRGITHPSIILPPVPEGSQSVWHLFPVLTPERDSLAAHLERNHIQTATHYPLLSTQQKALPAPHHVLSDLKQATCFAQQELSLPIHPFLTDAEVQRVIDSCNQWK
jgi:dTDP-3-amino-3,4,6-trideoxy-alpha-D-glucose transaminase